MGLQRRLPRSFVPTWRKLALSGLGVADTSRVACADLTAWQQSQDPRCAGAGAGGPAVYVAPTVIATPACAQSPSMNTQECQNQVIAANLQNIQANADANRAVFIANCNRDWEMNAARYRDLGLTVPPNDCAYRGYGQTLPGTTGGYSGYLPGTPQEIIDWRNANPGGGSLGPAAGGGGAATGTAPSFAFTNLTSGDNTNFRVGDRWQIQISGPQNAPVSFNGGRNGENLVHQVGSTDQWGRFTLNGQMGQAEIGEWVEAWRVNDQIVASFSFRVLPAGSVTSGGPSAGSGTRTAETDAGADASSWPSSINIAGSAVPLLALGAAAAALFFFMRGR